MLFETVKIEIESRLHGINIYGDDCMKTELARVKATRTFKHPVVVIKIKFLTAGWFDPFKKQIWAAAGPL